MQLCFLMAFIYGDDSRGSGVSVLRMSERSWVRNVMKKIRAKVHAKWQRFHKRRLGEKVFRERKLRLSTVQEISRNIPELPRNFLDMKFA